MDSYTPGLLLDYVVNNYKLSYFVNESNRVWVDFSIALGMVHKMVLPERRFALFFKNYFIHFYKFREFATSK